MDNWGKEYLLISTLTQSVYNILVDILMIDVNVYCTTFKLKGAQIFAVSMGDLEFQITKEVKFEIDLKKVILKECYNLLDIFLKKQSNIFPLY